MPVASPTGAKYTAIRPVPKPRPQRRRRATVEISRLAAHRLASVQGHVYADIAADLEAVDALDVGRAVDRRRDPLILEMVRCFSAIEHDLSTSAAARALATRGKACGLEAIRLDRIVDEHGERARLQTAVSIEAGRAGVVGIDGLLTGREP